MICGQIHLPSQFWHVATLTINRKNALRRITFPSFPFDMSFHTFCAPVLSIRMIARVHVCVCLRVWICRFELAAAAQNITTIIERQKKVNIQVNSYFSVALAGCCSCFYFTSLHTHFLFLWIFIFIIIFIVSVIIIAVVVAISLLLLFIRPTKKVYV